MSNTNIPNTFWGHIISWPNILICRFCGFWRIFCSFSFERFVDECFGALKCCSNKHSPLILPCYYCHQWRQKSIWPITFADINDAHGQGAKLQFQLHFQSQRVSGVLGIHTLNQTKKGTDIKYDVWYECDQSVVSPSKSDELLPVSNAAIYQALPSSLLHSWCGC